MCWAPGCAWIHFTGIQLLSKWTLRKWSREVQRCRRAYTLCSTPQEKDWDVRSSIPGLATHHQEMFSITNCQILLSPRKQLRYMESRCSFYVISVLPMGALGLRGALAMTACFSFPSRCQRGQRQGMVPDLLQLEDEYPMQAISIVLGDTGKTEVWQTLSKLTERVANGRGVWVWYSKISQDFIAWDGC